MNYGLDNTVEKVLHKLMKQKEQLLLDQLGELVSRGLLVIEETPAIFVKSLYDDLRPDGDYKFELRQTVRFVLKDQEYIEKLEKENKELQSTIDSLRAILDADHSD